MRTAKRYLLLSGSRKAIEKAILDYIGSLGWAKSEPVFVNTKSKKIILSVNRKETDKVIGAFAISGDRIEVLKVSGTLKGLGKR